VLPAVEVKGAVAVAKAMAKVKWEAMSVVAARGGAAALTAVEAMEVEGAVAVAKAVAMVKWEEKPATVEGEDLVASEAVPWGGVAVVRTGFWPRSG